MVTGCPGANTLDRVTFGADEATEIALSLANEIRSYVDSVLILDRLARGFHGEIYSALGSLFFGKSGTTRRLFDCTPITVPGLEIHVGIDARRIEPQQSFHPTHLFKDLPPIDPCQLSQGGKRVVDRDLSFRLMVLLEGAQFLDRLAKDSLQPAPDKYRNRFLTIEVIHHL